MKTLTPLRLLLTALIACSVHPCFSQNVSINATGAALNTSAGLDIDFNDKGLLVPRMDSTHRNAISSPAQSLVIFNTSVGCMQMYNPAASMWENMYCLSCISAPSAPVATAATSVGGHQMTANWNAATGAASYILDVATDNNFVSGFVITNQNMGNVLSYTVTGLSTNVTYYYRVRAVNNCGASSNSSTLSATTTDLSANLVHYWKFDGTSTDAVGSNNGSDVNVIYSGANGKINNGAGFISSTSINIANLGISGTGNRTWSFWIKTTTTSQQDIFTQRDGTSPPYGQFIIAINWDAAASGKVNFFDYDGNGGPGSGFDNHSTTAVNDGNWHFMVFVKSGTSGTWYKDGVADGTFTASKNVSYDGGMTGSFGYDRRDNIQYFNGALDEIGLWSRALSPAEIVALYNGGTGLQYPF